MNFNIFKKSKTNPKPTTSSTNECIPDNLNDILRFQENSCLTLDERLNFLYPLVDENITKLPRGLSSQDKSDFVRIPKNKPYQCEYSKTSRNNHNDYDVGSIRSLNPIPVTCEIYYYEVKILNRGERGKIAVGLTASGTNLNRQPGWDPGTFAYHGDDGCKFQEQGYNSVPYGPKFETNDVIGCGWNFKTRTCFFTRNGNFLGIAFKNMPAIKLYPTIGMHSKNESVNVNLGQNPFMYNIKMEMILNEAHAKDL